ncbi:MAG: hypothetical protein Q4A71_06410 [Actinomycetaceae bacterium]|nr:hypothetical protein [Actinomycetaceae bacterium]
MARKALAIFALGFVSGLFASSASLALITGASTLANKKVFEVVSGDAQALPFAISALTIFLLTLGKPVTVTHHMTIIGALAAVRFLPIVHGNMFIALIIGSVMGIFTAWLAEIMNRAFYAVGDTHIDPSAVSI